MLKKLLIWFLVSIAVLLSFSCPPEIAVYTVIYDANGAAGGAVPIDGNAYQEGDSVTVLGNTGSLAKPGWVFAGWNSLADGSGSGYSEDETFNMGVADVTLYVQWAVPVYRVIYDANGADSGSVPVDSYFYEEGVAVSVLGNSGDLAKAGCSFDDWNTIDDGTGQGYDVSDSFTIGAGDVTLYAQWIEPAKLLASDGWNMDEFGVSVSVSGDYVIVGADQDDDDGESSGSAYIYQRTDTNTWGEEEKLNAAVPAEGDRFGCAVAINGDYAIVGAYKNDDNGIDSGSAYIYRRTDTNTWGEEEKLNAAVPAEGDRFGYAVAIDGDYAIVGAYKDDDNGTDSGSAYIYRRTDTNTWEEETKITASDGGDVEDEFGISVAISGDYAIVGAGYGDGNASNSGSAYVFHRTGTLSPNTWDAGTEITDTYGAADDEFGYSVAISGDYAIVGAEGDDDGAADSGSAYIFHRTDTNIWDAGTKINGQNVGLEDYVGRSVAISGDYAVIGAYHSDGSASRSGSIYIFHRTGTNVWDSGTKVTVEGGAVDDSFGYSVAIEGRYIAAGAKFEDDNGLDSGSAYAFRYR